MAVTYKGNQIEVSKSSQKFSTDVVYARPDDVIKLDVDIKNVKITFVNGDVDFIFPNGSIVSLASYGVLAFGDNPPKIYDASGNLVSFDSLLQNVEVLKPEDAILILANRDKVSLVDVVDKANKVLEATDNDSSADGGNPVAGQGDSAVPTIGFNSKVVKPNGVQVGHELNNGKGDYLNDSINTTNLDRTTNNSNRLPGNSDSYEKSTLVYSFLYGDSAIKGASRTINNNKADYYGIDSGTGNDKSSKVQLDQVAIKALGGEYGYRIFDGHSYNGVVKRTLNLDYSGGIFPESIKIFNIPTDKDQNGELLYRLKQAYNSRFNISYDDSIGVYTLTQLDGSGKLNLDFIFPQDLPDRSISLEYRVSFVDPKTGLEKEIVSVQDVSITSVNKESDLNMAQAVINKGASGITVDANDSGGDINIFIGGSTGNKFSSKGLQNLVFTGGGNDTIDLSAIGSNNGNAENIIYGSTGYDIITGSGSGKDYLVFSNDKAYNGKIDSSAVKDSYYETMKKGVALQFYLGMYKGDVSSTLDKLGISNKNNNNIIDAATSNFVYSYNSLTVIGDYKLGTGSSIANIVGSLERDVFNLYFGYVNQSINITSGNAKGSNFGDEITISGASSDTVTLTLGDSTRGLLRNANGITSYTFDSDSFNKFTGSDEQDYIYIKYNGNGDNYYSKTIIFDGGKENNNTIDFSSVAFEATASDRGITFSANLNYENVSYRGLNSKKIDYFYNFSKVIGSSGDDIFYGYASSRKYEFDGGSVGTNYLSYEKSSAGVTLDMANSKVYKTNGSDIVDYDPFARTADTFDNIQKITLSNYDDVVIGNLNANTSKVKFDLGSGNDTVRYDVDKSIDHIEVIINSKEDTVKKYGPSATTQVNEDKFEKGTRGSMSYIGTAGDDVFYGADIKSIKFDGKEGTNTLNYSDANVALNFDLSKGTVSKGAYNDTYKNITNIIGGNRNDIFSLGSFDPTQSGDLPSYNSIDGGKGVNTISFTQVKLDNLSDSEFALIFEMPSAQQQKNSISFYDKNGNSIELAIKSITNIDKIEGTVGNDFFMASETVEFNFDGGLYDSSRFTTSINNVNKVPIYGNTLSYKNVSNATNLEFDLKAGRVTKLNSNSTGASSTDTFSNMQGFIGGEGDDTFRVTHSLGDTSKYFDGGAGNNTLSYSYIYTPITFDLDVGSVIFTNSSEKDNFNNINKFVGGYGKNVFKLTEVYKLGDASNQVEFGGNGLNNYISFESFSSALGQSSNPFELKTNGKFTGSGSGATTYSWNNVKGFIGTSKDDFFTITEDVPIDLDGGEGEDTLSYAGLVLDTKITVNVATGSVVRATTNNRSYDTIKNIDHLILGSKDDTVLYAPFGGTGPVTNFKSIDGGGGSNTLDFSTSNFDLTAKISATSIDITESAKAFNTKFSNFQNFNSSRSDTFFYIDNESDKVDVTLKGHAAVSAKNGTVIDLKDLQGDVTFYNFLQSDVDSSGSRDVSEYEGRLEWNNSYTANIRNTNINKIVFNANNNNTVYGSKRNNTFYSVEGTITGSTTSTLSYADADFKDILKVYINNDKQAVNFVYNGTTDYFKGFNKFIGSSGNDVFLINDVNDIPNNVLYDAGAGTNTLSFEESKSGIQIDVSLDKIQLNGKSININNIEKLVLSSQDDIVVITTNVNNSLLFKSIDGGAGNNKISIESGETLIFNEKGDNELALSGHSSDTTISNFQEIRTSTQTGNKFYGSSGNDIRFAVDGASDSTVNFISYEYFLKSITLNFYDASILKVTGNKDYFEGIQYFVGSAVQDTFILDVNFNDSLYYKSLFNIVYINYKDSSTAVSNGSKDIISIVSNNKTYNSGISFDTNAQTMTKNGITSVQYKWTNIDTIKFTDNQTVYVSYDNYYSYNAVSEKGDTATTKAVLSFDKSKSSAYKTDKNVYVIIDFIDSVANINTGAGSSILKNIKFSGISEVVATGNSKDIIYGGSNIAVKYKGAPEYTASGSGIVNTRDALPTLDYSKFVISNRGITVNFNSDNTATISKPLQNAATQDVDDSLEYIQTIIGTNGQDTFVLADNSNEQTYKIFIDGGKGVIDTVDLSRIAGSNPITLDANSTDVIGTQYHYSIENINSFLLGAGDDIFKGALKNDNILGKGSNKISYALNIDGGGGVNTLDYQTNFSGYNQVDNVSLSIDLSNATITKTHIENGKQISSVDRVSAVTGKAIINFSKILLEGKNVTNTLIVSNGTFVENLKVNAIINDFNQTILQTLSFEYLDKQSYSANITWDDSTISASFNKKDNGKEVASASYVGFNNIILGGDHTTFTIKSNVSNFAKANGILRGSGVDNKLSLVSTTGESNSIVTLDLYQSTITFNKDASTNDNYIYQLTNILQFNLGFVKNIVYSAEISNYDITFDSNSDIAEINYSRLNSSKIELTIKNADNSSGLITFEANKNRGTSGSFITNKDEVVNAKKVILGNNDDKLILDKMGVDGGKNISIDGGGGINTISLAGFANAFTQEIGDEIKLDGYDLQNFSNLELTNYDDTVYFKGSKSQLTIDGGKGKNIADYTRLVNFSSLTILDSLDRNGNFCITLTKASQHIDTLTNFQTIILNEGINHYFYSASVVKNSQSNLELKIDFNNKNISSSSNTVNYGGLSGANVGISATIQQGTDVNGRSTNEAVVKRDGTDSSIKDTLLGINVIEGTGKGDNFEVSTKVQNLTIDAIKGGSLRINYTYNSAKSDFIWDLNSKSVANGIVGGISDVFLHFNGIRTLEAVFDKNNSINAVTNTFLIYDLSSSYVIDVDNGKLLSTGSTITLDFSNYAGDSSGQFNMDSISLNNNGYFEGTFSSKTSSNTISYSSITTISGSNVADTNKFNINLSGSNVNYSVAQVAKATLVGKHSTDSILITLTNKPTAKSLALQATFNGSSVTYTNQVVSSSGSFTYGLSVKAEGINNITITNPLDFKEFDFHFNSNALGSYILSYNGGTSKNLSTPLNLDFAGYATKINVNLSSNNLDIYDGKALSFSAVKFSAVTVDVSGSGGTLTLTGNSSLKQITNNYKGFTDINVQDGASAILGTYTDLSEATSIDLQNNSITLNGQNISFNSNSNSAININLPFTNNKNLFINLNLSSNAILQTVNINSATTTSDGKSKTIVVLDNVSSYHGIDGIYIGLNNNDTVSFGNVANPQTGGLYSNQFINITNVTAIGSYKHSNNFYLKYGKDFQYYSTSDANVAIKNSSAHGFLQYLKVSGGSLTLDYTDLAGNQVSLEGVSGGTNFTKFEEKNSDDYSGIYMGFNGVDPDWTKGQAQVSLEVDTEGLFNNTTIIAPNTGIRQFNVTAGFFRGFVNSSRTKHIFIIDGSRYENAKVNVSNGDVSASFEGSLFSYEITFGKANDNQAAITNYELQTIDGTQGLHWQIKNVGYYKAPEKVDSNFTIRGAVENSIYVDGGVVQDKYVDNQYNIMHFNNMENKVDLHFSLGTATTSGSYKYYASNISGTISGKNVSLVNFSGLDLGDASGATTSGDNDYSIYITMDFIPNFRPITNGNSGNKKIYKDEANIVFKYYTKPTQDAKDTSLRYYNQTLDMTTPSNITTQILVSIDENKSATIWEKFTDVVDTKGVHTITPDQNSNSFVAKYFTVLKLPIRGATVLQADISYNYKIEYAGKQNNLYYYIAKNSQSSVFKDNVMTKISTASSDKYYDTLINVNKVVVGSNKVIVHSQNGSDLDSTTYIIDANDSSVHNNSFTYTAQNLQHLDLVVTGIGVSADRTVINLHNVARVDISTDGISHYRSAFVDSDSYIDNIGSEKHFDTKGYFVLEDTNTGKLIYFKGEDLSKFSRIFDELLHSKGSIEKFSSYKEMAEALENKTASNEKYDDSKDSDNNNNESKKDTGDSSYENNNHAYVQTSKPENASKDNVVENHNESNNKLEDHNNIDNNTLNVLHEEESNHAHLDIKASDVLDGLKNSHNIDDLSNDVFNHLEKDASNVSEDHSSKEILDSTIDSIKEISTVVEKANLEITLVVHENEYNNEDPTSKLDNMLHKESSLNGHNHR